MFYCSTCMSELYKVDGLVWGCDCNAHELDSLYDPDTCPWWVY